MKAVVLAICSGVGARSLADLAVEHLSLDLHFVWPYLLGAAVAAICFASVEK